MSEYIPFEIQAQILKRVPVKPLIQFRCVSKAFKCLIDSPDFIASYGVGHPQPNRFILRYSVGEIKYSTLVDNDDHTFVQQDLAATIPDLVKNLKTCGSGVVGSSHGLLCLVGCYKNTDDDVALLWNPSISKSVGIHLPNMWERPPDIEYDSSSRKTDIGFGVCPVTFDPTILHITCFDYRPRHLPNKDIYVPWKVEVFTLSIGTWSILSTNLPHESVRLEGFQVVIDRFIYWVAKDAESSRSLIMSFDLTAKKFKEINLTNRLCSIKEISKLRESLVVLEYPQEFDHDLPVYCLWMMKEQGVFRKLYTIKLPDATHINTLLGFRKTGELILEVEAQRQDIRVLEKQTQVMVYELNSQVVNNLGISGEEYWFFMYSYEETLLLLDLLQGFIYPRVTTGHK